MELTLLLAHDRAVEYWERGRLRTAPADQAPSAETVLTRLLHTHRRRFRSAAASLRRKTAVPADTKATGWSHYSWREAHGFELGVAFGDMTGVSLHSHG